MSDKPKLLWHSNSPWSPTGYGQQTALLTPKLTEHYEVAISSFYGLEGHRLEYGDMMVLPGAGGTFGNETLPGHIRSVFGDLRGGLVLTLMDVWVLDPRVIRQLNCCCWVPVDHEPVPPRVEEFFRQSGAVPIAMTEFGQRQLADLDPLYVPHGIDTAIYSPMPTKEARELTHIPQDAFVVGMVAANKGNPSRKCFAEALLAFKAFADRHDDALLYLHTDVAGTVDGVRLGPLIEAVGVNPEKIKFPSQYRVLYQPFSPETMRSIYGSMDVLLAASAGEGFGIPVVEANACGVPAIVTDFSAQPEVLSGGWTVDWKPRWSVQESWQADPDVENMVESLNHAYSLSDPARKEMAEQCREGALRYDADTVLTEYLLPVLGQVQERFEMREPVELKAAA